MDPAGISFWTVSGARTGNNDFEKPGDLGGSYSGTEKCRAHAFGRRSCADEKLEALGTVSCRPEGNHGEDVKEEYFYLDSTPTHSYMKALYKYPHAEFPYAALANTRRTIDKSRKRTT